MKSGKTFAIKLLVLLGCILLVSGCVGNKNAPETGGVKAGDNVSVDYIGRLENGTVFDTSIKEVAEKAGIFNPHGEYKPLEFRVGAGEMINGFDEGVKGMKVGEEKNITIPPAEAYGEYNKSNVQAVPLEELGLPTPPKVGDTLTDAYGMQIPVIAVNSTHVTLDLNHPLAGKTLIFDVKLVSVNSSQATNSK